VSDKLFANALADFADCPCRSRHTFWSSGEVAQQQRNTSWHVWGCNCLHNCLCSIETPAVPCIVAAAQARQAKVLIGVHISPRLVCKWDVLTVVLNDITSQAHT